MSCSTHKHQRPYIICTHIVFSFKKKAIAAMARRFRLLSWHPGAGRSARAAIFPNPRSRNLIDIISAQVHHFVRECFEAQEVMGHYVISLPHPGQPGTVSTQSPGRYPPTKCPRLSRRPCTKIDQLMQVQVNVCLKRDDMESLPRLIGTDPRSMKLAEKYRTIVSSSTTSPWAYVRGGASH